ncbi:hypothetical protein J1792_20305 [Streptomyces triculaminicus]|uniref:Uncharacterized protein n=1 Tax=Streptomyces triculaminicus TaxID=2816232 RepID=A0A939JS52_9ACTN|nr:hypothetical protein [Streptomyces triculaminicus]MBO0655035.1 hypothetical protein [Streptomyces triculaminicus]
MNKTREQAVADNIWGASALFMIAAFVCFNFVSGASATKAGWILYACGWVPVLAMLIWCAIKRRKPGVGGAVSISLLIIFALVFWLNHS